MATIRIGSTTFSGTTVTVRNNRLLIDGNFVESHQIESGIKNGIMEVHISGVVESVQSDASVTVVGQIKGDVHAGGTVNCECVGRDVTAGGSVRCGRVGRDIHARGNVRHA